MWQKKDLISNCQSRSRVFNKQQQEFFPCVCNRLMKNSPNNLGLWLRRALLFFVLQFRDNQDTNLISLPSRGVHF
jgi:hypothetical protein